MSLRLLRIPLATFIAFFLITTVIHSAGVRVKDLAYVRGVRDNQLVGYGLVVGLNGTGDSNKATFTVQSVANMLQRYGILVSADALKLKNVAAVMVTATIPAFAGSGDRLDLTVSSLGDAKSLEGGVLLQTPLLAGTNNVYAVGQGSVTIGGFNVGTGRGAGQRNHATVGLVPGGALVEREVRSEFVQNGTLELVLKEADFTTAERVAATINAKYGATTARARNAGSIEVTLPAEVTADPVAFVASLELLTVTPDATARVVVNERTGTVVLGGDVKLSACAVSHGNLNIRVQPPLLATSEEPAAGTAAAVAAAAAKPEEQLNRVMMLPAGASVTQVVDALNAIGAGPRDIIAVLQAIREAGALHAELVLM